MILNDGWNVFTSQKIPYQSLNKNVEPIQRGEFHTVKIKSWSQGSLQDCQKKVSQKSTRRIMWVWHCQMLNISKILRVSWLRTLQKFIMNTRKKSHTNTACLTKWNIWKTLNSMNAFCLSLVMSYIGSQFKWLWMSWYKTMKPFQTHLKLVIKKYLFRFHESFLGVKPSSNYLMLSEMSEYISSYNFKSISFDF